MHWGENTLCICGFGPVPAWVLLSHEWQSGLSTNPAMSGLPCCCGILTAVQSRALVRWLSRVCRCFLELKLCSWGWLLRELRTQFLTQNSQMCVGCGWHMHEEGQPCLPWFSLFCLHGRAKNFDLRSYLNASWHYTTTSFCSSPAIAVFVCIRNLKSSWSDNCFQYMKPRRFLTCGN